MTKQFEKALSVGGSHLGVQPMMKTDELIKNRFDFYLSILKGYVKYLQEVENKPKTDVQENVNSIMNKLIEQYGFGNTFVMEMNKYITMRFHPTRINVYNSIKEEASMDTKVFDAMLEDMKESSIFGGFNSRFRSYL